ncbi:FAD-dependent monooxygenase [Dactylosporangium sp. NPDC049525]|uniref:FAD-dependent monooxygenase n=1 Tax=Dactylosporangium sp. NPDC049525 TaxID=3154730 RepID=UPI0034284BD7
MSTHDERVLVVGAGPVGAVLALELARHGIPSVLVERSTGPSRHPKMDYVNGRSMELLRRLGLAEEIRARGIGAEHQANFLWTRGFQEPPVRTWQHESVAGVAARLATVNDGTAPLEPYQRVQGSLLEEIVRREARDHPLVDLVEGWAFTDLEDTGDGVVVSLAGPGGQVRTVRAPYVAACDGANSTVRRCLGIPVEETGPKARNCSVYFRSTDPALRRHGRAFVTISARGLTLVSRDEADTWTGSIPLHGDGPFTADPVETMRQRLGTDFAVDEVLNVAVWEGSLSVASTYRSGSVFLVGDSAHHFFPTGGHGANTGLADAVDLGWKLAAVLHGWGGPRLLASYEAERRPVALFNREMCANLLEVWRRFARMVADGASREHLGGFLDAEVYQLDNVGVHFGYRYSDSPVIWPEQGTPPPWRWHEIVPTTWPGSRAPSLRLADGTDIFDRLGTGLTLVDFTGGDTGAALVKEALEHGVPMEHLAVDDAARAVWERDLVLVRPDQHVAWRGDAAPEHWAGVLDHIRGH